MCLFSPKFFPHMTQISAFPLSSVNFILMETIPLSVGYLLDVGHSIHSNVNDAHELISLERLLHFVSCIEIVSNDCIIRGCEVESWREIPALHRSMS